MSQSNLLKDQTIGTDVYFRMDDDPVGMGDEQTSAKSAIRRNIRSGNDRPESVPKQSDVHSQLRALVSSPLIIANGFQE